LCFLGALSRLTFLACETVARHRNARALHRLDFPLLVETASVPVASMLYDVYSRSRVAISSLLASRCDDGTCYIERSSLLSENPGIAGAVEHAAVANYYVVSRFNLLRGDWRRQQA
jgi:hypothetical protein